MILAAFYKDGRAGTWSLNKVCLFVFFLLCKEGLKADENTETIAILTFRLKNVEGIINGHTSVRYKLQSLTATHPLHI